MQNITLSNGVEVPALGFGCAFGNWTENEAEGRFFGFQPDLAWKPIQNALEVGYRHFDTAYVYGTHSMLKNLLGQQYSSGKLQREDLFLTTKVFHPAAGIALNAIGKTLDLATVTDIKARVLYDFERSLDELGHGYVDLLLMHWPGEGPDEVRNRHYRKLCWQVFEELHRSGMARAIGTSNFLKRHLETMIADTDIVPQVNQIEISPYIAQQETVAYCQEEGIVLEAWAPFGSGATGVLQDPVIGDLAQKYGKNVGQVILRWLFQRGIISLPKSSNPGRMKSNLEIFDFALSDEEVATLNNLDRNASSVKTAEDIA